MVTGRTRSGQVGPTKTESAPESRSSLIYFGMVLIAQVQQLKSKLMLKGKSRPEKMVAKKMPDGAGMLSNVPQRKKTKGGKGADEDAADKEYCVAMDKVSSIFGRQKRSNSTGRRAPHVHPHHGRLAGSQGLRIVC